MALSVMVIELMEKASSPYSAAFEVPMACEALPRAIPLPIGLCTRINLKIVGADNDTKDTSYHHANNRH